MYLPRAFAEFDLAQLDALIAADSKTVAQLMQARDP